MDERRANRPIPETYAGKTLPIENLLRVFELVSTCQTTDPDADLGD